jgi:hypothetical protein
VCKVAAPIGCCIPMLGIDIDRSSNLKRKKQTPGDSSIFYEWDEHYL